MSSSSTEAPIVGAAPAGSGPRAGLRRHLPALRLAVTVGLLAVLAWTVDPRAVIAVVTGANPTLLLLMLALLALERATAAKRWHMLLRIVSPPMPFWPVMRVTLVSNFVGSFLPGGVGIEVLKVHGLARYAADLPLALSSVLLERLFGLLGLLLMIGLGLLIAPVALSEAALAALAVASFALAAMGVLLLVPAARRPIQGASARLGPAAVAKALGRLGETLDVFGRRPHALAAALVFGLFFQALRVVTVMVGATALGIAVDPLIFVAVVPLGLLVAMLPISLGGYGPREATYVGLLALAGVAPGAALTLSLSRELLGLVTVLPGAWLYAAGPTVPRQATA